MNNFLLKESAKLFLYTNVLFYFPLYFYYVLSSRIYDVSSFLYAFVRWDSGWYLGIAQSGYPQFIAVEITRGDLVYIWPPLYPLILKILTVLLPFPIGISVFLLQSIILFGVIYTTIKLLNIFVSFKDCKKITLLFIMFPISIFFYTAYAEGVFLIFLNTFLYYLIKGENYKAALIGSFLPVIKYIGIFSILILNFFVFFVNRSEKRSRFNFIQVVNLICVNIIFLIPFGLWILFNYFNTMNPLFFLTVRDSVVAFKEWGKFNGPFYFYFLKWLNMLFSGKHYWIEYDLAGFFVILYVSMNIITSKIQVKKHLTIPLKALSCLGIFFAIYPFTIGIESLWRYGYIFPIQFLVFKKLINKDYLYNFLLILFACFKIAFGIAFISSLHVT